MIGIICYNQPVASGYLPQTTAYIAASGAAFSTPQKDGIDRWFRDLLGYANGSYSTANVFSKINIIYPFLTGTESSDRVNAVSPGTYNYTSTGGPTYNTTNKTVSFDGFSQYLDTNHTPNGEGVVFANSDLTGMGIHRTDSNNDSTGTVGEVGGGNSYFVIRSDTFRQMYMSAKQSDASTGSLGVAAFWMTAWASSSSLIAYRNGSSIKTNSLTWDNTATRSAYIGAFHAGGPGYGGPNTIDFYIEVKNGWSTSDVALIYNATKALKAVFGITWT